MKFLKVIVMTLFTFMTSIVYSADNISIGKGLLIICESKQIQRELMCLSYINGVRQGIFIERMYEAIKNLDVNEGNNLWEFIEDGFKEPFCLPEPTDSREVNVIIANEIIEVVKKYLKSHPKDLKYPSAGLIRKSWVEAFPCSKKVQK